MLTYLDNSNGILFGCAENVIQKLQQVQNFAAKAALQKSRRYSSKLALCELHWLPIKVRIEFKIITMMYQVLRNPSLPAYLKNLICHNTCIGVAGNLRSNANNDELLVIPYVKCKSLAWRSFSVAGLRLWNHLPNKMITINDNKMFKKELKTHLFANMIVKLKNLIYQQFIVKYIQCNVNIVSYVLYQVQ